MVGTVDHAIIEEYDIELSGLDLRVVALLVEILCEFT
jgi:hypothetical protein